MCNQFIVSTRASLSGVDAAGGSNRRREPRSAATRNPRRPTGRNQAIQAQTSRHAPGPRLPVATGKAQGPAVVTLSNQQTWSRLVRSGSPVHDSFHGRGLELTGPSRSVMTSRDGRKCSLATPGAGSHAAAGLADPRVGGTGPPGESVRLSSSPDHLRHRHRRPPPRPRRHQRPRDLTGLADSSASHRFAPPAQKPPAAPNQRHPKQWRTLSCQGKMARWRPPGSPCRECFPARHIPAPGGCIPVARAPGRGGQGVIPG
jgi:hypothetical protein